MTDIRLGSKVSAPTQGWAFPETVILMTDKQVVTVHSTGELFLYGIPKFVNAPILFDGKTDWYVTVE